MSTPINYGGPAFPSGDGYQRALGMTLRDYFAAAALQGMIACEQVQHDTFLDYARIAYQQADAMVAERTKKEEQP